MLTSKSKFQGKKASRPRMTMLVKLVGGIAFIVMLLVGASLLQLRMQNEITDQIRMQHTELDKQQIAIQLKQEVQELALLHASLVVTRNGDKAETYKQIEARFMEHVKAIGDTVTTGDQRKWSATLNTVSSEFTATFYAALDTLQTAPADQVGRLLDQQFALSQTHKEYMFEQIDLFYEQYTENAAAAVAKTNELFATTKSAAAYAIIAAIGCAVAVASVLTLSLLKPIRRMQRAMRRIEQGDISHRIAFVSRDEFGELGASFDRMMDQMEAMMANMRSIGSGLGDRSAEFSGFARTTAAENAAIVQAIGEIATGGDQQASLAERSASLASELGFHIADIASSADRLKQLSSEADEQTKYGSSVALVLNDAAGFAKTTLDNAGQAVETFVTDAAEIGQIVRSMTEMASQTNVLALNASIEAARAGAHGKGFLVIADEVRRLSGLSKTAAGNIAALVTSLQEQTETVRAGMKEASRAADEQQAKVEQTLGAFRTIREAMEDVRNLADAIHGQVRRAEQENADLNEAIESVAAIAEQTAAMVQEVNSSSIRQNEAVGLVAGHAEGLQDLAEMLLRESDRFRFGESGTVGSDTDLPLAG